MEKPSRISVKGEERKKKKERYTNVGLAILLVAVETTITVVVSNLFF